MEERGLDKAQRTHAGIRSNDDHSEQRESIRLYLWSATLLLIAISLLLPGIRSGDDSHHGWEILIFGPLGGIYGEFRWLANVFLLWGLILVGTRSPQRRLAIAVLGIATAVAASCIVFPPRIVVGAGDYRTISAPLAVGGYVWILANVSALVLGLISGREAADESQP